MSAVWSAVHYSRPRSLSLQSEKLQPLHPIDSHARQCIRPGRPAVDRINCPPTYQVPTTCNPAAVCPVHLSLAGWVTEEQLTARAADHGHGGNSDTARPSAVSTIASAHFAERLSLPSAKLELMIRVNPRPRIFGARRPRQSADL